MAIICVVLGHTLDGPLKDTIYVFHMPFFFLIGGYFFRPRPFGRETAKRFTQLIVPYLAFLLILSLPELTEAFFRSGKGDVLWRIKRLLLGGEGLTFPLTVFWFPTCYFFTVVIYNGLRERLGAKALWIVCAALLGFALANQFAAPDFWLPLGLNVAAMAIPLFHIGAVFGHRIFNPSLKWAAIFALISVAYVVSVLFWGAPGMSMKRAVYGLPVITALAAIACSGVVAWLGVALSRLGSLSGPFVYCGGAAMTIMYVHMPAIGLLRAGVGLENPWLLAGAALGVSLLAHACISSHWFSRRLLLGQT